MTAPFGRAALLLRTVRHLRTRQVAHRLLRLVRKPGVPQAPDARWASDRAHRLLARLAELGPVGGAAHAEAQARAWLEGSLVWLGVTVPWAGDWRMRGPSPLWRYHLQYHEHLADAAWLAGRDGDAAVARRISSELQAWHEAWKDGGAPTWDGYPVAVRLVSWLRILAWAGPLLEDRDRLFIERGIATHTLHLSRSLEWHIDGNHLLRDTWALALGAAVLEGPWAERLQRESVDLFEATLAEQVLPDGWHEERTPMYHARALRDALEVRLGLDAAGTSLSPAATGRIDAMLAALPWMQRPDGTLWHLNDTADDHGVDLERLLALRRAPIPDGVRHFDAAHAVVLIDPCGDRLRLDLGAPAPAHQPGHAHAGALGFEYDVAGVPFIADGGCSGYDGDPWREYLRGTSAHSTLTVDGRDQSELWATFRMGARASVTDQRVAGAAHDFTASARVRPYHARGTEHRREFSRRDRTVTITDLVTGAVGRRVEGFVHFAPEWEAEAAGAGRFVLRHPRARVVVTVEADAQATLHRGERAPVIGWRARGFNDVVPSWTLRLREDRYAGRPWRMTFTPS